MKLSNIKRFSSKGFTLIELLIVIAILGILAAGVLVAINPVKRINQARDSTIKSDIAQIATAMQTYYTAKGTTGTTPYYPSTVKDLADEGELKSEPKINGSTTYTVRGSDVTTGSCTADVEDGECTNVTVFAALNEAPPGGYWCWSSVSGTAKVSASAPSGDTCP